MFLPWVGLFEQVANSDAFIHYDDVQLPQGRSFINRVQIKTAKGPSWLTLPIKNSRELLTIEQSEVSQDHQWQKKMLNLFAENYRKSQFFEDAAEILDQTIHLKTKSLAELNIHGFNLVCDYFDLNKKEFHRSSLFPSTARSSERLLELVKQFRGSIYLTGHGARNYLNHELFEREGVEVRYMNYRKLEYTQLHSPFDPHVSILDLIANKGKEGKMQLVSGSITWREMVNG